MPKDKKRGSEKMPGGICGLFPSLDEQKKKAPVPVVTNFDKIRAMGVESLAEWLVSIHPEDCPFEANGDACTYTWTCQQCWLDWLQSPEEGVGRLMADELIRRRDVLESIMDMVPGEYESQTNMKYDARMRVKRIPAVDAVEVVRCRECKRYKTVTFYDGEPYGTFCDEFKINGGPDFYCAYGQRREEATDGGV